MSTCRNCSQSIPSSDVASPCRACTRSGNYLCTRCLARDWRQKIDSSSSGDDSDWKIACGCPPISHQLKNSTSLDDIASYYKRASKVHKSIYNEHFFECTVCRETKTIKHSRPSRKITNGCNHQPSMCLSCLGRAIKVQYEGKRSTVIRCPEAGCPSSLEFRDVKAFAPSDTFAKYDFLVTRQAFEKMPDFRWCVNSSMKCTNGFIHVGGKERPMMTCPDCKFVMCFNDKVGWHSGQTCAQYQKGPKRTPEAVTKTFVKASTKQCPNCSGTIFKDGGCNHMTCSKCAHEFCWICLRDWKAGLGCSHIHVTLLQLRN